MQNVQLVTQGDKLILPAGMTFDEGILWLTRFKRDHETIVKPYATFKARPLDGAYAFTKTANELFGYVGQSQGGHIVTVEVNPGVYEKVYWGSISLPGIDGVLECGADTEDGHPVFVVKGEIKKGSQSAFDRLVNLTREKVHAESIYRGKALVFEQNEDDTGLKDEFGFFKLNGKGKSDLILPQQTYDAVDATIFTLIEKSEKVKARGVPSKRAAVLDGRPGTGKTLAMTISAGLAVQHGMTFVLLRNVEYLKETIDTIQFYGYTPAIVAAEDIDRVTSTRDDQANLILNAIDGVDSKSMDIRFLFTTNDRTSIIETFTRAGRTDNFITLPIPDAQCAATLLKRYADSEFALSDYEYLAIGELLAQAESLPSNIAEVCQRAKLYAICKDKDYVDYELMRSLALNVIDEKRAGQPKVASPVGQFELVAKRVEALAKKARVEVG